jgi:hypothetical protein
MILSIIIGNGDAKKLQNSLSLAFKAHLVCDSPPVIAFIHDHSQHLLLPILTQLTLWFIPGVGLDFGGNFFVKSLPKLIFEGVFSEICIY